MPIFRPKTLIPLALAIFLPLLGSLLFSYLDHGPPWMHTLLHSTIEASGSGIALVVAAVLIFQSRTNRVPPHFLWVALALICMGILDFFHGIVELGPSFYWSRTIASLLGGILFMGYPIA